MKIKSGNLELFDSKSFIALGNKPIDITFGDDEGDVTVSLVFLDSDKPAETMLQPQIEFELLGKEKLIIKLIDWNNQLGVTATEMISGGTLFKRPMHFAFGSKLLSLSHKAREIVFSIYMGEAE